MDLKRKAKVVQQSPKGRYVRFNEKLGEGAFKKVYRAWDTTNGVEVAWYSVKMSALQKRDGGKRILQEMQILQQLDHPNIIKFYASWLVKEEQTLVFITEIITAGTLKSFTQTRPVRLKILKRWCREILEAIEYLHSFDPPIIHRDLKCDNIFINGSTGDIRIGDLGLASWHRQGEAQSFLGTPEYMAPELYEDKYDEQVDIYAFGMCVLEILTKQTPYLECTSTPQIFRKVTNGILPKAFYLLVDCPTTRFIQWCIDKPSNDGKRPSAKELLESDFLRKNGKTHKLSYLNLRVVVDEKGEDSDSAIDCASFLKQSFDPILQNGMKRDIDLVPCNLMNQNPGFKLTSSHSKGSLSGEKVQFGTCEQNRSFNFKARRFVTLNSKPCLELLTPNRKSIKFLLETKDTPKSLAQELLKERLIDETDLPQVQEVLHESLKVTNDAEFKNLEHSAFENEILSQVREMNKDLRCKGKVKRMERQH